MEPGSATPLPAMSSAVRGQGDARKRQSQRDVHPGAESRDLHRRHADVVIGREHGVELTSQRPHEHRVRRQAARPRRASGPRARARARPRRRTSRTSPAWGFRATDGEPWRRNAPPVAQGALGDPPAAHHPIGGHLRRDVLEGDVRRDEHHPQLAGGPSIIATSTSPARWDSSSVRPG